jgi:hypothetical protein
MGEAQLTLLSQHALPAVHGGDRAARATRSAPRARAARDRAGRRPRLLDGLSHAQQLSGSPFTPSLLFLLLNEVTAVPSDVSWRTPLIVQLIPGALLLGGCVWLPPSPRLLVLQNRAEEALPVLARLREREVDDSLVQVCVIQG